MATPIALSANIMADINWPKKERTLRRKALDQIVAQWDKPLIDIFSTNFSAMLPMYGSPVQDPQALQAGLLRCYGRVVKPKPLPLIDPPSGRGQDHKRSPRPPSNRLPFKPTKMWFPFCLPRCSQLHYPRPMLASRSGTGQMGVFSDLRHLKANTKVHEAPVHDFFFAYACILAANSENDLQRLAHNWTDDQC